jgi:hypothetical protein
MVTANTLTATITITQLTPAQQNPAAGQRKREVAERLKARFFEGRQR